MQENVLKIIAKVAKVDVATLKPELNLVADLKLDSPKALQLLCDLEEELKIDISEDTAAEMNTVGDVLALIPPQ